MEITDGLRKLYAGDGGASLLAAIDSAMGAYAARELRAIAIHHCRECKMQWPLFIAESGDWMHREREGEAGPNEPRVYRCEAQEIILRAEELDPRPTMLGVPITEAERRSISADGP